MKHNFICLLPVEKHNYIYCMQILYLTKIILILYTVNLHNVIRQENPQMYH